MKNIGISVNPHLGKNTAVTDLLTKVKKKYDFNFYCQAKSENFLPEFVCVIDDIDKFNKKLDIIWVFGGDGTILHSIDFSLKTDAPVLGINLGRLGFLADTDMSEFEKSLNLLINKKYRIQSRMLLKASLKREGKLIYSACALNDAVIYKGTVPHLIKIKVYDNKRFVLETRCDGIIASTPTGSTAYNLSAGGPILSPVTEAFVVSPLNPHLLSVRPLVFPASINLAFLVHEIVEEAILQLDGRNVFKLKDKDELFVKSDSRKVNFVKLNNKNFFQILRKKMHMGKS